MIVGHYATALLPRHQRPQAPFWLFLLCSNLADFLWMLLAVAGIEKTTPVSVLDVTFKGLQADMYLSHTGLGTLLAALLVGGVVSWWHRDFVVVAWCSALVGLHFLEDLLCGFQHPLLLTGPPVIGLDLYHTAPHLALVIEALFGAACTGWFVWAEKRAGRPLPVRQQAALYAVFVIGALIWWPTTTIPMRTLLPH